MPMMEEHPKYIKCECSYEAYRNWGTNIVKIPESFQSASTLYNNDTASDFNYISGRMKHGTRPSGKTRAIY